MHSGRWTSDLRNHAASCPLCRESIALAAALQRVALKTSDGIIVPASYRVLWIRAQFVQRQERLSKVDFMMLIGSLAAILLGFLGVGFWKWPIMGAWIMNATIEPATNLPLYIIAGCAAFIWLLTAEMFMNER